MVTIRPLGVEVSLETIVIRILINKKRLVVEFLAQVVLQVELMGAQAVAFSEAVGILQTIREAAFLEIVQIPITRVLVYLEERRLILHRQTKLTQTVEVTHLETYQVHL